MAGQYLMPHKYHLALHFWWLQSTCRSMLIISNSSIFSRSFVSLSIALWNCSLISKQLLCFTSWTSSDFLLRSFSASKCNACHITCSFCSCVVGATISLLSLSFDLFNCAWSALSFPSWSASCFHFMFLKSYSLSCSMLFIPLIHLDTFVERIHLTLPF